MESDDIHGMFELAHDGCLLGGYAYGSEVDHSILFNFSIDHVYI